MLIEDVMAITTTSAPCPSGSASSENVEACFVLAFCRSLVVSV